MRRFLSQFFTWWNGQTLGTRFHTWRRGEPVGTDGMGNRYYRTRDGKRDARLGYDRRWVIYADLAEASMIPPGWHAWIHHRTDTPPAAYQPHSWERPHQPNLTGSPRAYRPAGSILTSERRPTGTGDYEPWTPEG
jgi:NADH:ubiquinone oxidoreductase subunit